MQPPSEARESPRVLFVLKWRVVPYDGRNWGWMDPGTPSDPSAKLLSHGLNNSCRFIVDMLHGAGIEARLVQVADDNDIWRQIAGYDPTHVVLEAYWARPKKLGDLAERFPGLPVIVRGHSSTPFLAEDAVGFPWALDYLAAGGVVAQNDLRHVAEMRFLARHHLGVDDTEAARRVPYLPNYYPDDDVRGTLPASEGGVVNIGCFGAIRSLKNQVGQAIAALMFADKARRRLRFHINGDRLERGGHAVSRALDALFADSRAELVRHDWIPTHAEFLALVRSMDLVMQVSFAETFNIVAADAVSQGVPVVGSAEIPWLPRHLCADPTSTSDMARVVREAWAFRRPAAYAARHGLRRFTRETRETWLTYLRA